MFPLYIQKALNSWATRIANGGDVHLVWVKFSPISCASHKHSIFYLCTEQGKLAKEDPTVSCSLFIATVSGLDESP